MKLESKNYFKHIDFVLKNYMRDFKEAYKRTLEEKGAKATGNLIKSINITLQKGNETYEVWLNVADYYYYVDKGRREGNMPPVNSILKWIEAKKILPREASKLPREKQQLQLAWAISKSIGIVGTMERYGAFGKGTNALKLTMQEVNERYIPLLQEALESDWYEYSMEILDTISSFRV